MNDSMILCPQCRNRHHQAQHRFTESGTRSAICMHCEGPREYIACNVIVPQITRTAKAEAFPFSPSGAMRAARERLGKLINGTGAGR